MRISTKGRYALKMLVHLAEFQGEEFISLAEISSCQHISKKYLEQIVLILSISLDTFSTQN
ncbi:MAG: RrF2 family transcriptional regulator [Ruminococcus sp.]